MAAVRSNGAVWHSGEHRVPASGTPPRGDVGRSVAPESLGIHRELGRWKARVGELERRVAVAESSALGAQVTPHFICNALQAVSTLLHRDPRAANSMVVALSDLLRMTLHGATRADVPLARELTLVERYVDVMRFRLGDELRLTITATAEARQAFVPQLLLQPLVENSIVHGLRDRGGVISIDASRQGGMLRCTVADDGRGLPAGPLVERIGLATVRGRLEALFGDRHRLELVSNPAGGATASLLLPYRTAVEVAEGRS